MKYSDLREPMSDWLARQLSERVEKAPATKPTGELALGDGDLTWRGPGWVADGSGWPADGLVGSAERAPAGFCVPTAERRRSREVSGLMRRLLR